MTKQKALPADITKFFQGESVFFQELSPPPQTALPTPQQAEPVNGATHDPVSQPSAVAASTVTAQPTPSKNAPVPTSPPTGQDDGMTDGVTSWLDAINFKAWQEVIENTETQSSALRLTSAERYAVEDVVNELRRAEKIKTSMNELARLGLLLLIHDFKQHKRRALLYRVKKA
jgi:hypothetical protein